MKGKVTMSTIQKKEFAVKSDLSEKANLINIINESLKEQNIVSTVLTEDDIVVGTPEALVISGNDFINTRLNVTVIKQDFVGVRINAITYSRINLRKGILKYAPTWSDFFRAERLSRLGVSIDSIKNNPRDLLKVINDVFPFREASVYRASVVGDAVNIEFLSNSLLYNEKSTCSISLVDKADYIGDAKTLVKRNYSIQKYQAEAVREIDNKFAYGKLPYVKKAIVLADGKDYVTAVSDVILPRDNDYFITQEDFKKVVATVDEYGNVTWDYKDVNHTNKAYKFKRRAISLFKVGENEKRIVKATKTDIPELKDDEKVYRVEFNLKGKIGNKDGTVFLDIDKTEHSPWYDLSMINELDFSVIPEDGSDAPKDIFIRNIEITVDNQAKPYFVSRYLVYGTRNDPPFATTNVGSTYLYKGNVTKEIISAATYAYGDDLPYFAGYYIKSDYSGSVPDIYQYDMMVSVIKSIPYYFPSIDYSQGADAAAVPTIEPIVNGEDITWSAPNGVPYYESHFYQEYTKKSVIQVLLFIRVKQATNWTDGDSKDFNSEHVYQAIAGNVKYSDDSLSTVYRNVVKAESAMFKLDHAPSDEELLGLVNTEFFTEWDHHHGEWKAKITNTAEGEKHSIGLQYSAYDQEFALFKPTPGIPLVTPDYVDSGGNMENQLYLGLKSEHDSYKIINYDALKAQE